MRDVDAISVAGLLYAILLVAVTAIFFTDQLAWPALGAATALFNHGMMIRLTKRGFSQLKFVLIVIFRLFMYGIMMAFVFFDLRDLDINELIKSYVFLLLGFSTIRMGVFLHYLPFIKKHTTSYKEEVEARMKKLEEDKLKDVE